MPPCPSRTLGGSASPSTPELSRACSVTVWSQIRKAAVKRKIQGRVGGGAEREAICRSVGDPGSPGSTAGRPAALNGSSQNHPIQAYAG